ncbi:MAG TPA: hypothetical protein EYP14_19885 [Planctomycetaceae bacterium]|nr:hypothetical protein [Planctomycetaceae bacterium]
MVGRHHQAAYVLELANRRRLHPFEDKRFGAANSNAAAGHALDGRSPVALLAAAGGVRGDAENRIKELKCDLAMDRTSCHSFLANQFRLLLHAAAFVLLSFVRRCLAGTELATAQVCTLQRKLLKLGVLVTESCRKVWLHFASSCPVRWLWPVLLERLRA